MMTFALSLAGSVMVTVSVVSLLPEAFSVGGGASWEESLFSLGLGCSLYWVLSQIAFPEPGEILGYNIDNKRQKEQDTSVKLNSEAKEKAAVAAEEESRRAWRLAMLLFVSLLCHNFPEGSAVAASTSVSPHLGITTALAIALHNIPEGIAIAVPALQARPDDPRTAFALASLSGLAEPVGAAVTLALIEGRTARMDSATLTSSRLINDILAFVAGIMMTVAIRELFPEALRHSKDAPTALVAGTAMGIIVMLATEMYLQI